MIWNDLKYIVTWGDGSTQTMRGSILKRVLQDGADIASYKKA